MTPNKVKLIRETWHQVVPIADTAARLFYQRLFDIDPSTIPLFVKSDMKRQRDRLLEALGLVVENAGRLEQIAPALMQLGRRHVRYGVEDRHYDSVGDALIWTLEQGLGDAFTADVRDAWTATYAFVASTMRQGAREVVTRSANRTGVSTDTAVTSPLRSGLARAAVVVCLTLGTAVGLTAVTAPMTATQVEAGVWGKIKKGVKKGFGAVKDSVKAVRSVDKAARDAARDGTFGLVGKTWGRFAGGLNETYDNAVGSSETPEESARKEKEVSGWIGGVGKWVEDKKDSVKGAIIGKAKDAGKKAMTGKITRLPPSRPGLWGGSGAGATTEPNALARQANKLKALAPARNGAGATAGLTLERRSRTEWTGPKGADQKSTIALKPTRPEQTPPNKRPPSGKPTNVPPPQSTKLPPIRRNPQPYYPRPYPPPGHKHPPQEGALVNPAKAATAPKPAPQAKAKTPAEEKGALGNDRSRWGRPVGSRTKPDAMKGAKAPVHGITKENLKPANPEKVSVRPKRNKHSNNRSRWGRPVGSKRHTLQSRGQVKQTTRSHRRDRKTGHIIRGRSPNRNAKHIIRDQQRDRKAGQIIRSQRSKSMTHRDRRRNNRSGMDHQRKQNHSFRMQRNQDRHAQNNNRDFGRRHQR